ncbi:MAG: ribosome biogenesis GTP-binding protein YihA/YsxC [Candidatus Melainabacteria bacterium]
MSSRFHIAKASFIISAPDLARCPDMQNRPEVAVVGRSNVGKSSFINALVRHNGLAKTSQTPGKTRLLNYFDVQGKLGEKPAGMVLVDLPGYGYARVSKTEQAQWRREMERFLKEREPLKLVLLLVDSRHGPQENDCQMAEWLQFFGLPILVIMTKVDKLSKNVIQKQRQLTAKGLDVMPEKVIPFSAVTKQGLDDVWRALIERDLVVTT